MHIHSSDVTYIAVAHIAMMSHIQQQFRTAVMPHIQQVYHTHSSGTHAHSSDVMHTAVACTHNMMSHIAILSHAQQ